MHKVRSCQLVEAKIREVIHVISIAIRNKVFIVGICRSVMGGNEAVVEN